MRRTLHSLFHFLGGIWFAVILIAATACLVIAGTFLESWTDSHRYAAHFTYNHPLFGALLGGFFINILFSSLRRWPFRLKHIPFLITHLGLLMILGGTMIKNGFGVQGNMVVMEGSGSQQIFMPGTFVVHVEKRENSRILKEDLPLPKTVLGEFVSDLSDQRSKWERLLGKKAELPPFPELSLELLSYTPHSQEKTLYWIKGSQAYIEGLPPLPVHEAGSHQITKLPISYHGAIPVASGAKSWASEGIIYALRCDNIRSIAELAYFGELTLSLVNPSNGKEAIRLPLAEILRGPVTFYDGDLKGTARGTLHFDYDDSVGIKAASLTVLLWEDDPQKKEEISLPLMGPASGMNKRNRFLHRGTGPLIVNLHRLPTLLFAEDTHGDTTLLTFGPSGEIHSQVFHSSATYPLIVFDKGYGGYAIPAAIPGVDLPRGHENLHFAALHHLFKQMGKEITDNTPLAPSLELLRQACRKTNEDFLNMWYLLLHEWEMSGSWLYPRERPLPPKLIKLLDAVDIEALPYLSGCLWTSMLSEEWESQLNQSNDLVSYLNAQGWPSSTVLKAPTEEIPKLFTFLTQQLFAISDQLEPPSQIAAFSASEKAHLLSAGIRAQGFYLTPLLHSDAAIASLEKEFSSSSYELVAPVTHQHTPAPPRSKLEDNRPQITLKVAHGAASEIISMTYDPYAANLKQPILNGSYLIRFQPASQTIPYRIRLRSSRQVSYPLSNQPYSYESELLITRARMRPVETLISMNNVYETWDGYRFYMASLYPNSETRAKKAQIVVNQDPAKYWLTYPGAGILTLGILLLFWMALYRKQQAR